MLSTGETYRDLGADCLARRDPERQTRRLVAQLERLGHTVTLTDGTAAARASFFPFGTHDSPPSPRESAPCRA
jgi:hypothetical protein